jgi:hypothetical protein
LSTRPSIEAKVIILLRWDIKSSFGKIFTSFQETLQDCLTTLPFCGYFPL